MQSVPSLSSSSTHHKLQQMPESSMINEIAVEPLEQNLNIIVSKNSTTNQTIYLNHSRGQEPACKLVSKTTNKLANQTLSVTVW